MLAKFADLPQEAAEEFAALTSRRRIVELERQIKSVSGANGANRIDQLVVQHAVAAAVERKHIEWQRKMEQGRVRFQRLGAVLASTGQSLSKIKELLEETEREWIAPQTVDAKGYRDSLRITEAGTQTLGSWEPLPAGAALIDHWRNRLGKAERLILDALIQAYPNPLSKEKVAARAGYEASGGGFNNALGRLGTLELVEGRGELRASDDLLMPAKMEDYI